ncbi:hypothetical protein LZC95_00360 [Pendulispora brunnea]|uniref:NAD glycohydrolase translocation F5/8 type C domain-containing protein n=1 Tax=Pendulispora brunnea TaxID=2905690 RepID=A0ABZ2K9E4_9BACT
MRYALAFSMVFVAASAGCKSGCASSRSAVDTVVDATTMQVDAVDAGPPEAPVNLLYRTPAVVAVSSKVNNPRDFPEHLIDGKPSTAWNGKTGDLVGGWIAFRVPSDAQVMAITMTAGFDAKSAKGEDLFKANHRIKKVRVWRDGVAGSEVALDIEKRAPQRIAVNAAGGEYRIEIVDVVPGTKKEWRELVVSEFAVWGRPGATQLERAEAPAVRVGSLDAPAKASTPHAIADKGIDGPYESLPAFCKAHTESATEMFKNGADEYPGFIDGPYCVVDAPLVQGAIPSPFSEVGTVRVTSWNTKERVVWLKTPTGVFVTAVALSREDLRSPGCAGGCSQEMKDAQFVTTAKGPALVVKYFEHCFDNPWPSSDPDGAIEGASRYSENAAVCYIDSTGAPSCKVFEIATAATAYRAFEDRFAAVKWDKRAKESITADGELTFDAPE